MGFASFCVSFLGFLVASFFIQGLEASTCPKHWYMFEDFCYALFKEKLTWNEAEADCNTYGKNGHLASILSEREMAFLSSALRTNFEKTYRIWIGLYKIRGGKTRFRWSDHAKTQEIFWAHGQPSNCKKKQNCVELYTNDYKSWNDQFCEIEQPYLCKTPLD
ncbi:C-type lectin lectoxin-Thr1-like [Pituophis catenifer annectens]|uniref:C-type lectin lectoxin-Thr1-like n=1 Tax=Pituophis catenifer annectens TaxID=94852 RepID=UPI0039952016